MTMSCLDATERALGATGLHADEIATRRAQVHVAQCPRCDAALAAHHLIAERLGAAAPTLDERAQRAALARLAPALDRIDARRARPWWRPVAWIALPALAAAAALLWWLRAAPAPPRPLAVAPVGAAPTVTPGPRVTPAPVPVPTPAPAPAVISLGPGEQRTVALASDARTHAAIVGPGQVEIVRSAATGLELAVTDAIVIGEAGDAPLWVRGGGVTIRAQRARFAASMRGAPSVLVERGVIDLDRGRLRAGQWHNRDERAAALRATLGSAPVAPAPSPARPTGGAATTSTARSPARAAATPPSAAPSAPPIARFTAAEMYAAAEAALDRGDRAGALLRLRTLVEEFPAAPQRATALYELASHARRDGDLAAARAWLALLDATDPPAGLAELAAYLGCRLAVDEGDRAAARRCFAAFAKAYPSSPHADAARGWGQPEAP